GGSLACVRMAFPLCSLANSQTNAQTDEQRAQTTAGQQKYGALSGPKSSSHSLPGHIHQLLQHLIGGRYDPRARLIPPLRDDHVGEFLRQVHVRSLKLSTLKGAAGSVPRDPKRRDSRADGVLE